MEGRRRAAFSSEGFRVVEADRVGQLSQHGIGVGTAVVVAQEHDVLGRAGEDVLECGAPVAEPEAGAISRAMAATAQPSPEIYGFEVGPEVEVARVLHVAAREFVLSVNLDESQVLTQHRASVVHGIAEGYEYDGVGEEAA